MRQAGGKYENKYRSNHCIAGILCNQCRLESDHYPIPEKTEDPVRRNEPEGVQSHLEKAGTPTMGGLIILISVLVTSLFFIRRYPNIIPVLFLTLVLVSSDFWMII